MKTYDAIVIGGGPAGLTAVLYLLRSHVSVALVEKLSHGGQMLLTEKVDNYPGFPKGAFGYELADLMMEQVDAWKIDSFARYTDEVVEFRPEEGAHRIKVGDEWIEGKSVIICTGARYKKLGLENEKRLTGRGVSYCGLCDGNFFRDQVVAVVGGGNSALEESLYLARLVKKLYLIHRRDDFRGSKCYQDKCFVHPKITTVRSTVVTDILGEDSVTGLQLRNVDSGEETRLDVEGVFVFIGFEPVHGFLPPEIELDSAGFVVADQEMLTSVPGVYVAGDIRSKLTRQVATAVGDGATAAGAALVYLENIHV